MMDLYKIKLEEAGLSVRSYNILRRNNIETVGQMAELSEEQMMTMRNMGRKSMEEIRAKVEYYQALPETPVETQADAMPISADWVCDYLRDSGAGIDVLTYLSPRAYNSLTLSGYTQLWQIMNLSTEDLVGIPHIDEKTAEAIKGCIRQYLEENETVFRIAFEKSIEQPPACSASEPLKQEEYRAALLEYTKAHDRTIAELNLSGRPVNQLQRNGYFHLSEILFLTEAELMHMEHMGKTSVAQILNTVERYIAGSDPQVRALLSGDVSVQWEENTVRKAILSLYDDAKFSGLSFSDFQEKLEMGKEIPPERLKKIIGGLIAEGELEYTDYRCYMVYGHFSDYIDSCPKVSERNKEIIKMRLSKKTLDETGVYFGLTKERVRQILDRDCKKVKAWYQYSTGKKYLDEEYFRYFYETYDFDGEDAVQWLGMTTETWYYLRIAGEKQGTKALRLALEDTQNLDVSLRVRIRNYLNRDKIFVDDRWVEKKRSKLEEVAVRKYCRNAISFEEFCSRYNRFLEEEGIAYDPDLYYTDGVLATRKNRIRDTRFVLCSFHDHLRYYDIDSRDYTELWEMLNLDAYENIEISTAKFMNENPEIMKRYDIRDQYELHNLMRKTLTDGSFHQLRLGKMPELTFGQFDRNQAILDLLCENAPINMYDFADLLNREFGYDQVTAMAGYLVPFSCYLHRGVYDIDQKPMTTEELEGLKQILTEDFYYVDEIRAIYASHFPEGDPEKVNAYNLKNMGFLVLSKYVIQNHSSAEAYFRHLLTENDFTELEALRRKFGRIATFSNILMEFKRNLDIVEYEPNRIVRWEKLERSGMTKQEIRQFCDAVWSFTEGQTYFNLQTIQVEGFDSELFDYGFPNWFYSNLLLSDSRFSYGMMFGSMIFYRGEKVICIQSFLVDLLRRKKKADLLDFQSELTEKYGCKNLERTDITYRLAGSDAYYDDILDRLYSNVELYYQELEEDL